MPQPNPSIFIKSKRWCVVSTSQVKSIHLYTKCYYFFHHSDDCVAVVLLLLSSCFGYIFQHRPCYHFGMSFFHFNSFQTHTTNSFHIVNLFKGFFNMHSKINICYIMQKWNLLFSLRSSSSSLIKNSCNGCCCFRWMVIDIFKHQKRGVD